MFSMDDSLGAMPSASRRSSGSTRDESPGRSKIKRQQIAVACNACRKRKTKCDGRRPTCSVCLSKKADCKWSADPDATPMVAIKRKYQSLELESKDSTDLMLMLMDRPRQEACLILDHVRRTRDTSTTLAFVRDGDLLTWGRTGPADNDSSLHNFTASEHDSLHGITEGVDDMMPRIIGSAHGNIRVDLSSKASSISPKRRLAISDLVNQDDT